MTDMKIKVNVNGEQKDITASFGTKHGYSPYIVSKYSSPNTVKEILAFFMAPTLDLAIKQTAQKYLQDCLEIFLMTGDGQIIRITK